LAGCTPGAAFTVTGFTHYLRVFPQTLLNFFELRQWLCGT
jgi:hypothetical protein